MILISSNSILIASCFVLLSCKYLVQWLWSVNLSRRPYCSQNHRLNMELNLQSLFGLHVTWCEQLYPLAETPHPQHLDSYTRALLVSQDRRHLFLTPWSKHFRTILGLHNDEIKHILGEKGELRERGGMCVPGGFAEEPFDERAEVPPEQAHQLTNHLHSCNSLYN